MQPDSHGSASRFEDWAARSATMLGKATRPSQSQEAAVSSEDLHAPRERLTDQTIATHQAITSLMEELQAMDWYRQRADDCDDAELKAVLVHNMNDEMEHAAMILEWLRRNVAEFATQLDKFLSIKGPNA